MTEHSDLDFKETDNLENLDIDSKSKNETLSQNISTETDEAKNPKLTKEDILSEPEDSILIQTLKEELENLKLELSKTNDKMFRIAADAQNSSKQNLLDIAEARKQSKKSLVKNITPFLTTLVLSFSFAPDNDETVKFVDQLKSGLLKLNTDLENSQVKMIIPAIGDIFDPNTMQALNSSDAEEPLVKNVASVGCIVDSQVIQPASVLI
jgi:molecular chaperone GrpE